MRIACPAFVLLAALVGTAHAESQAIDMFQHHSWDGSGTPGSDASATTEDIAAVRFTLPTNASLIWVSVWFGPSGANQTVELTVWDDTAGTVEPGAVLLTDSMTITPGTFMQNLSVFWSNNVDRVRIGVTRHVAAPPAVGLDLDGVSAADRNFVKRGDGPWLEASAAGLTGDWIIGVATTGGAVNPPDGTATMPDGGASGDGSDDGDDATDDGPADEIADDSSDEDDDTGCCSSNPGSSGAGLLGLAVLGFVLAPRRRSC